MSGGRTGWHRGRAASRRALLCALVLLPALLLGQALGGAAAWLHSHGPAGQHLHLLGQQADRDPLGTLGLWHDAQHRNAHGHEHEDGADEPAEPAPTGLRIDLPQVLAAPPRDPGLAAASSIQPPLPGPAHPWHLAPAEGTHRYEVCRSGWPPQRSGRSGVAALLCSSHAILI